MQNKVNKTQSEICFDVPALPDDWWVISSFVFKFKSKVTSLGFRQLFNEL